MPVSVFNYPEGNTILYQLRLSIVVTIHVIDNYRVLMNNNSTWNSYQYPGFCANTPFSAS
jgi:hypothetical protein